MGAYWAGDHHDLAPRYQPRHAPLRSADVRREWRLYWSSRHALIPCLAPRRTPSWPERTWIRIFG